jgi:glycosyltransferase involved in cell wall biosynthesis
MYFKNIGQNLGQYINKLNKLKTNKYLPIILFAIVSAIIYFCYFHVISKQNNTESFEPNVTPKLSSVVLIGTARNIESHLPKTFDNIKIICDCFEKSNVIIYENDSTDKTLQLLQNWAKERPNAEIITEKNVPGMRTHRLAHGRNIVMNKALELNPEYVVVMDLDDVNNLLTKDAFMSSFTYPDVDWAVMTANQSEVYYDLWALRTYDDWMPFDCWACTKNDTVENCVNSRFKKIDRESPLISVKSAFGGLGIYKTKYLDGCKYDGGKDNFELCEHASFHDGILKNGGKIYINPKMINCVGKK